jgi:hypothetical protein
MLRVFFVLVALTIATAAQSQSDSGRHRPLPVAAVPAEVSAGVSAWHIGLNLGADSSGDLFRVRALNGSQPWDPEGGTAFSSEDFVVTLDEGFAYGVAIQRDLGTWLAIRADATFTRLPMTAEARVGETVRIYEYDDLSIATYGAGVEASLTRGRNHPFVSAGAGVTVVNGSRADEYDQTVMAASVGVGYQQAVSPALALRLEIRDTIQSIDFEDYRPPTSRQPYPTVTVDNLGPQHILGVTAGLVAGF